MKIKAYEANQDCFDSYEFKLLHCLIIPFHIDYLRNKIAAEYI